MNRQVREFISTVALLGLGMEVATIMTFGLATFCGWFWAAQCSMWFHLPGMALLDMSHLHLLNNGETGWGIWMILVLVIGWAQWCLICAIPSFVALVCYRSPDPSFSRSKALSL
jgi:hypothetical protein